MIRSFLIALFIFSNITVSYADEINSKNSINSYIEVNDKSFQKEIENSEKIVLLYSWAEWCDPCKISKPIFEEISKEYQGKIKFLKMNVDEAPNISNKYEIDLKGIPSFFIFKDGKLIDEIIGAYPKKDISKMILNHL